MFSMFFINPIIYGNMYLNEQDQGSIAGPIKVVVVRPKKPNSNKQVNIFFKSIKIVLQLSLDLKFSI